MTKKKKDELAERLKERIDSIDKSTGYWYIQKNDDLKSFKTTEGDNFIRVLPRFSPDHEWFKDIHVHYNVGEDNSAFLCLRKMKDEDCPICEEAKRLEVGGRPEEEYKKLRPARRTLFFVLDRDKEEEGIKLYDSPTASVGDPIINLCLNRRTREITDITDSKKGFDVTIVRKGMGVRNTRYKAIDLDRTPSELGDVSLLDDLIPFDEVLHYEDYDVIKAEFLGMGKKHHEQEDEPVDVSEDDTPNIDTGEDTPENKCPEGFQFGEDYDEEEECFDCKKTIRKECKQENKRLNDEVMSKL